MNFVDGGDPLGCGGAGLAGLGLADDPGGSEPLACTKELLECLEPALGERGPVSVERIVPLSG